MLPFIPIGVGQSKGVGGRDLPANSKSSSAFMLFKSNECNMSASSTFLCKEYIFLL